MKISILIMSLALFCTGVFGAEVLRVGQTGKIFLVSHNPKLPWEIRQEVCVYKKGERIACGKVVKLTQKYAFVKVSEIKKTISVGDQVEGKGNRTIASLPASSFLSVGLQLGGSISNLSFGDSTPTSSKTAVTVGASVEKPFSSLFSIESGIFYSQKGGTLNIAGNTAEFTYSFLEVPILAKVGFDLGDVRPFFYMGPYFAFLLSASEDSKLTDGTQSTTDVKSTFVKGPDYGIYFGGGAEMLLTKEIIAVLITRYGYGLANIDALGSTTQSLRYFQAMLGIKFPL